MVQVPCIRIRTGKENCDIQFHPSKYNMDLLTNDQKETLDLGFSAAKLLEKLLEQPGAIVARDDLIAYAWSGRVVGQGSLNQQIYTLRQILGDEKTRTIIQTVPRRGYLFNPDYIDTCLKVEDSATEGSTAEESTASPVDQSVVCQTDHITAIPVMTPPMPAMSALEKPEYIPKNNRVHRVIYSCVALLTLCTVGFASAKAFLPGPNEQVNSRLHVVYTLDANPHAIEMMPLDRTTLESISVSDTSDQYILTEAKVIGFVCISAQGKAKTVTPKPSSFDPQTKQTLLSFCQQQTI